MMNKHSPFFNSNSIKEYTIKPIHALQFPSSPSQGKSLVSVPIFHVYIDINIYLSTHLYSMYACFPFFTNVSTPYTHCFFL